MTTTTKREAAINAIIEYFKENEETFNECIEELDDCNDYLGDDRYYEMYMLDEFYADATPSDILARAFFGYDEMYTDSEGNHTEEFNPNRDFFRYNGYGNLVSTDCKDYSSHLDHYAIEEMSENRQYVDSIDRDYDLSELFDALEDEGEEETEGGAA